MELPSPGQFLLAIVFWSAAAMYVFWHADKNGSAHATRWGLATFLIGPFVVPYYFIRHWLRGRR